MEKQPRNTKTGLTASIIYGDLYFEDVRQCHIDDAAELLDDDPTLRAIRLVSLSSNWTKTYSYGSDITFRKEIDFEMTLRREKRGGRWHWYAYRRVCGVLRKRYVGTSDRLTEARLVDIAAAMPSKKKVQA